MGGGSSIDRRPDGLRIVIRAKREWPLLLYLVLVLGVLTAGAVGAIALANSDEAGREASFLLILVLLLWVLGVAFGASVLGWALFGREIVLVASDAVTVTRTLGPLRRETRVARDSIERLRTETYREALSEMFAGRGSFRRVPELWGLRGGSMVLDCGARTHAFGSKLDAAESRRLARLLSDELGLADDER